MATVTVSRNSICKLHLSKLKDGKIMETVRGFIFEGFKITADSDYSHEIKRQFLLGRKVMTS